MDDDIENHIIFNENHIFFDNEITISPIEFAQHRPSQFPLPSSPNRALQPLSLNPLINTTSINIQNVELEELKSKRIKFDDFIKLPKFREIFHQQNNLTFYCKPCHKTLTLSKPDKSRLIDHISKQSHKEASVTQIIDGLDLVQSITRKRIFGDFYFAFVNEKNRYYCGLCEEIFPVLAPYSHILEHEGTKRHLYLEKEVFGSVFSRIVDIPNDYDYLTNGEIPDVINHNNKVEQLQDKLEVMHQVEKDLNFIYPGIFAIEERIIKLKNGELKSKRFVCVVCPLQIDPSNYRHYLKRDCIGHLKSNNHKIALSGDKPAKYSEISNPIPSTFGDLDDPASPRFCSLDSAVYAARIVIERNYSLNSLLVENRTVMESEIGRIVSPKMVIRGIKELTSRIFKILQKCVYERKVALMIDETVKKSGRYIGLIVVTLDEADGIVKFYKMDIKHIPDGVKCDAQYITDYTMQTIDKIWPEGPRPGQIISLISDAVSYMDSATTELKQQPETEGLIHIKCLVHAVHRVAEELRALNPELASFCSWFQTVYYNACSLNREEDLKKIISDYFNTYYKPPKFFYIRWTTWIKVCCFHKHYWVAIVFFIQQLVVPIKNGRPDQSSIIYKLKNLVLISGPAIYRQASFVFDCYTKLNEALRELESPRSLSAAIQIVQNLIDYVYSSVEKFKDDFEHIEECIKSIDIYKKLIMVLDNNRDLPLAVERSKEDSAYENLPLTSAPIEDWFSQFRSLQSEYRPYTPELTCMFVLCKSNITRYNLMTQSRQKRKTPQTFGNNFDPKPKESVASIIAAMDNTISNQDLPLLLKSIENRKHTKITEASVALKQVFQIHDVPKSEICPDSNTTTKPTVDSTLSIQVDTNFVSDALTNSSPPDNRPLGTNCSSSLVKVSKKIKAKEPRKTKLSCKPFASLSKTENTSTNNLLGQFASGNSQLNPLELKPLQNSRILTLSSATNTNSSNKEAISEPTPENQSPIKSSIKTFKTRSVNDENKVPRKGKASSNKTPILSQSRTRTRSTRNIKLINSDYVYF